MRWEGFHRSIVDCAIRFGLRSDNDNNKKIKSTGPAFVVSSLLTHLGRTSTFIRIRQTRNENIAQKNRIGETGHVDYLH